MSTVSIFSLVITLASSVTMLINSRTMKLCGAETASRIFLGMSIFFAVLGIFLAIMSNI